MHSYHVVVSIMRSTRRLSAIILFGLAVCAQPCAAIAGGGPENLILIVNADSASSKLLANHYIHGRGIPRSNVIYLEGVPDREIIPWPQFKTQILEPLLNEIKRRKLVGQIDYVVYSSDFPTTIIINEHRTKLLEMLKEQGQENVPPQLFNPNASITSLTFFAGAALREQPAYMLLESNRYYRQATQKLLRTPFSGERQDEFEIVIDLIKSEREEDYQEAISRLSEFGKSNPSQLAISYWLAKFYGKLGDAPNATKWLIRALRQGWCFQKHTRSDLAFERVKDDPLFRGIVDRIPELPFAFAPTHGFKNNYKWAANGMLNNERGQGNQYFLSTILSVTRNYGINEKQAVEQLQRSIKADGTQPRGTFYFTDTKDVRSTTRKPNFASAITQLEAMGFETKIVNSGVPVKALDIVGLTCGTPGFDWAASGSQILPGAFCDNLTSFGGMFYRAGQTKCSQFLRYGAAGSSGTVVEPYALQAKFPHPMIHVHYARGCSLAESFYQSVSGPFQTIVVGDALCSPWAIEPAIEVAPSSFENAVKGTLKLIVNAESSPAKVGSLLFYVDGRLEQQTPVVSELKIDTRKLADGYHELRIVAVANNLVQTTGRVVLPVVVDNCGHSLELQVKQTEYRDTDNIQVVAKSTLGESIELRHNGRTLMMQAGRDAEFSVPAASLGRGPVQIQGVAISAESGEIASSPVDLVIQGDLAEGLRNTETPKKK
ncbi:hypothetical protein N9B60_01440 [Mariniblastus sp.]|nr:hypothetical protein [Mariniblastus sp.]